MESTLSSGNTPPLEDFTIGVQMHHGTGSRASGEHYDGSTEYYDAEIDFEIDINQDGTIGKPITTDLQDFPPEVLPGTSVVNLPVGYETSGLTWHQGLEKIFAVSDEGVVSMMNRDGTELVHWNIGGDFEAITVADHTSNFVYIGIENPDSVNRV